jgi:cell shape-determining protein MreC
MFESSMRRQSRIRSTLLTAAAVVAAAVMLFLSPPRVQRSLRGAVLDVVTPGQAWVGARCESGRSWALARFARLTAGARSDASSVPPDADARLTALDHACRRLRLENARLREELSLAERYGVSPVPASPQGLREQATIVRAAVISRGAQSVAAEQFLSSGRSRGLAESDVVLDETAPRLDQGSEAGVESELDVLIGRCVVGRVSAVGRWASALEPVTDSRYRGLAQIIRPSDQGGAFGAEGILVGQGTELLKLTDVPTTQSVRVGDEVYTSDRDRRFPVPLYYGRVVRVKESGRNWDILVRPAVRIGELRTVGVVRFSRPAGKTLAE